MNKFFLSILLALSAFFVSAQNIKKPKLVVGVIVDQMRYEYLYRFENHYGDHGFKRLLSDGFSFKNAHYNYIPTYTGPGHASVYTGTTPRVHGIIANDWYDKFEKRSRYCVEDSDVKGVDGDGKVGQRSPKNMKSTTVTDELRLFYQNRSKVVGIALKDRGAILPAGHQPNGAYWFDAQSGNFITSTFYRNSLPKWLVKFNKRKLAEAYMSKGWDTYKPIETYVESARDDRSYEGKELGGIPPVFPYDFKQLDASIKLFELLKVTPHGNTITTEMSLAALDGEDLGKDEVTDFLAISYSSPDYVGHAFGPYSKEIQDVYIRLDLELERLMKALDEKVGKGNWTIFLTADHAVADIPAYLKELGHGTDYMKSGEQKKAISQKLEERFGTSDLIENISNHQIFLNKKLIAERELDLNEVKTFLIAEMNQHAGMSAVFDAATISNYAGHDLDVKLIAAGHNARMSGDIVYTYQAGWLGQWHLENGGTTHGSGYSYDTHVPMLFYGWGIKQGSTVNYHPITDIAPTISTLLNIKLPSGCTGQPAAELLD
ncbi:Type I phosphodiesterase / nucleotide pyrophosphatase [Reichenbachiella faecimaris]|uniref:Type I phosphodiesterase / nucleotide pyrophosphatase n=1 Tax=Reichenbachiella faecimaris TaxID=692418 RepID=A0A1W2GQW5_REIFA|nr:alkaline phosphatase PafA [Reichenbachiella faecimaris]SMD39029.1 Type I phosphodiesterase / nucleotide pyrophosphatase [Reichenbachiella faecimaris]